MLLNCGVDKRLLRVPWTAQRSHQSILKQISSEYSSEGLMLKLQYSGHLMWRTDSLEKTLILGKTEGRRRRGRQRMRWLDGITGVGDGQGSLVCCSPWGHKESDTTEWLNWISIYIKRIGIAIFVLRREINSALVCVDAVNWMKQRWLARCLCGRALPDLFAGLGGMFSISAFFLQNHLEFAPFLITRYLWNPYNFLRGSEAFLSLPVTFWGKIYSPSVFVLLSEDHQRQP